MLTRPRRTREYTGPTPHSVAIQVSFFTVPSIFRLKKVVYLAAPYFFFENSRNFLRATFIF